MIDEYTRETAARTIKGSIEDFKNSKRIIQEKNRGEYLASLGPGAQIPNYIKLSPENESVMTARLDTLKQSITGVLSPCINNLLEDMAAAPSTEAVNTISLLEHRKNISLNEINLLIEKYGDNVQTYKAIKDIAEEHDYYLDDSEIEIQYNSLVNLQNSFDMMTTNKVDQYTDGYFSMINLDIDNALGVEAAE